MRILFSILLTFCLYFSQQHCLSESVESHSHNDVNHHHHHHGEEHSHLPLESIPEADLCCQPMIQASNADFTKKIPVVFNFFKATKFVYQSLEASPEKTDLKKALQFYKHPPNSSFRINFDLPVFSPNGPPLIA